MKKENNKITLVCNVCEKEFEILIYRYIKGKGKYCSRKCLYIGLSVERTGKSGIKRRKQDFKICKNCNTTFESAYHRKSFCSHKCYLEFRKNEMILKKKAKCLNCGNDFVRTHYDVKCCSAECWMQYVKAHPRNRVSTPCTYCGKMLLLSKTDFLRSEKHFCRDNNKSCYYKWQKENVFGVNHHAFGKLPPIGSGTARGGYRKDLGHYVRSSWEANVARWLIFNKYTYEYEPETFLFDGFSYTPDFYVPSLNQYIEVKGHWRDGSRKKVDAFIALGYKLWIIDEKEYAKLGFNPRRTIEIPLPSHLSTTHK